MNGHSIPVGRYTCVKCGLFPFEAAFARCDPRRYAGEYEAGDVKNGCPSKKKFGCAQGGGMNRHNYNPASVNDAIAASNRAGRRIGGKEARAIHRLLQGRERPGAKLLGQIVEKDGMLAVHDGHRAWFPLDGMSLLAYNFRETFGPAQREHLGRLVYQDRDGLIMSPLEKEVA